MKKLFNILLFKLFNIYNAFTSCYFKMFAGLTNELKDILNIYLLEPNEMKRNQPRRSL